MVVAATIRSLFSKTVSLLFLSILLVDLTTCAGKKGSNNSTRDLAEQSHQQDTTEHVILTSGQLLQAAIDELAADIAESIIDPSMHKVAVIPFTTLWGEQTELGLFLTEKLTTALSTISPGLEMIERAKIDAALAEIKLGETGLLSEESIQKAGEALGVDAVVVGSLTDLGAEVDINVRLFSVSTLKIFGRATGLIPKDKVIEQLLSKVKSGPTKTTTTPLDSVEQASDQVFSFFDDFNSSDFSRYTIGCRSDDGKKQAGRCLFNPEAGIVEVFTGDDISDEITFHLERELGGLEVSLEFLPTKVYPRSGQIMIYALTSSGNGYVFSFPASSYTSGLFKVLSIKQSLSMVERDRIGGVKLSEQGGHSFSLGNKHTISLSIDANAVQGIFDGKIVHSTRNEERFVFKQIWIRVTQMDAYLQSISVTELK